MSVEKLHKVEPTPLAAADVEEYLQRHPDFFHQHLGLLEILKVPHPSGVAVSLVSRQLDLLRTRNRRIQVQLNDIVQIARDNDSLHQRLHKLTLALLDATNMEDAMAGLRWGLLQYFQADFVALRIFEPSIATPIANLCVNPQEEGMDLWGTFLEAGRPECGQGDPVLIRSLFGSDASEVQSLALVPLQHAGLRGLLGIGSRDPARFQEGMGALFLLQMGEIVSARLAAMLGNLP